MDDTAQTPRIPSNLPIRLETLPPAHLEGRRLATLFVAIDSNCDRCDQLVLTLRIEPNPDVDLAGNDLEDLDVTLHFCPKCLEQLAREVRDQAKAFT